jgi:putative DNA primase/helicase
MIPAEMQAYAQWVIWKNLTIDGRVAKVPLSPHTGRKASCTDARTWGTFEQAEKAVGRYGASGLGFVFTANDPFCGIDVDDAFATEEATRMTRRIAATLSSYTEWSPSGKGIHIIVRAELKDCRHPKGIGMFDRDRYFTMTGRTIESMPLTVNERQAQVDRIFQRLFSATTDEPRRVCDRRTVRTDREVIARALAAPNGSKFEEAWTGDLSRWDGNWSRADLYLMTRLAFWTNKDAAQMERLFRQSGLNRKKLDSRRPVYGTYLRRTIYYALRDV